MRDDHSDRSDLGVEITGQLADLDRSLDTRLTRLAATIDPPDSAAVEAPEVSTHVPDRPYPHATGATSALEVGLTRVTTMVEHPGAGPGDWTSRPAFAEGTTPVGAPSAEVSGSAEPMTTVETGREDAAGVGARPHDNAPSGPDSGGAPELYSRDADRTNADVLENGSELPRTSTTVADLARRGGIDLSEIDVHIVEDADEARYLDRQGACAVAPAEKGGTQIRLGPASFADEETLVATLAHEKVHVDQLRSGRPVDTRSIQQLEDEAYAIEEFVLEHYRRSGQT